MFFWFICLMKYCATCEMSGNIEMEMMFYCCVTMCLLGKVHGSLARAGKVKGQTPKVYILLSF